MEEIRESNVRKKVIPHYEGLEIREYQIEIAKNCATKNSLIVLPTGLGKTIIGVLITQQILDKFPPNSKIIVLAPTRPLINQHYQTFSKLLNVSEEKFAILTGKILPENRTKIFDESQILFFTPQTLRNDLVNKKYTLREVALIIFDEAHHASGDYAYTMISDEFIDHNPDGIILGLTASPGSSKQKISELCRNLHIPVGNIHIRTRKDEDVKTYLNPMDIYKIGVDLTSLMEDIYQLIVVTLEERLHYLSQLNFLDAKGEKLHSKIIRKDLLKLNAELVELLQSNGDKTGIYNALSINAQALILYHMLELVEQQGLDVLLDYLNKLNKDSKKKNCSKATKILASDGRIKRIYLELKKNVEYSPENLIHPKYYVLVKIIKDQLQNSPSSRILVFVKLRNSVKNITAKLKKKKSIRAIRFVGQATRSQDDKGLSQDRQIEILEQFKKGTFNVLVSTNVGEEGLDIIECDLVIFYDVVASEIRYIQRKGRTARKKEGKVIILYSKGTRDVIYLNIALNKLNRMKTNLKNTQQIKRSNFNQLDISEEDPILFQKDEKIIELQSKEVSHINESRLYQSKLTNFLKKQRNSEVPIKISKFLPMKYGLRKNLNEDNIRFDIADSDLHIVIYNKVLVQIYNPNKTHFDILINQVEDFKQISSLVIIVFDFIDFKETIQGEKKLIKIRLRNISKKHNFQAITLDNEEELYFIIKNILETSK